MSLAAIRRQTNPLYLNFKGVEMKIIDHRGQPWVTAEDAGRCLGYEHPAHAINKLFRRNKDRFKANETVEIEIEVPYGDQEMSGQTDHSSLTNSPEMRGQLGPSSLANSPEMRAQVGPSSRQKKPAMRKMRLRLYSMRGLDRLGIYSRTEVGMEFHDWILDLIEGKGRLHELAADHHRLVTWFFERRPRWRKIHDLLLARIYSFEVIARQVGISVASTRRAINLMHRRGVLSSKDYESCCEDARTMLSFWREREPDGQLRLPI